MKFSASALTTISVILFIIGLIYCSVNAHSSPVKYKTIERNQSTTAAVNQINKTDF